jgi:hypothetical protein
MNQTSVILLSNETTANIYKQLRNQLKKRNVLRLRLAVSFLTESGVDLLKEKIKKAMEAFVVAGTIQLNTRAFDLGMKAYKEAIEKSNEA